MSSSVNNSVPKTGKRDATPVGPTTATKKGFNQELLMKTVQSLQFVWFLGQVTTLVNTVLYTLTYFGTMKKWYAYFYILAYLGVVQLFGILVYQLVSKTRDFRTIIKDDNVHYFLLGLAFMIMRPFVLIALYPFFLFSIFHVLAYTKNYLLPIFLSTDSSALGNQIGAFITANNSKSIELASIVELYSLVWLILRTLTFRKRSLMPLLYYLVFIKKRFETSQFTRNYVKKIELSLDSQVNNLKNPKVKEIWIQVKSVLRRIGQVHIVNDYTKEAKSQ
ncbi:uncharacterized protein KQ657_001190 [Scheffersomyces spartinae]|uniref:Nucleoporin POM33 n=1 Tax=Scheffersomyces spartinae TaxID=45513 RepID=A0A9P7V8C2_9ASCO|nr:uncharacterized protein KQ657_001190 [Scheffersomyces spartinae]KAG7193073.1 hypothetical protein KQ657_001190 [Scheffersomyces spartinae]